MADLAKIDRVSGNGTIREHLWDGTRTLCGLRVEQHQPPAGNAACANCEHISARSRRPSLLDFVPPPAASFVPLLTDEQGKALRACYDGDRLCGAGSRDAILALGAELVAMGLVHLDQRGYSIVFDDGLYALARWEGDAFRVQDLPFSIRACNVFEGAGIVTVGDLVQRSAFDLIRLKNFGRNSLKEVQEVLRILGRSLSPTNMRSRPVATPAPVQVMHEDFHCGSVAASTRSGSWGVAPSGMMLQRAIDGLRDLAKGFEGRIALNLGTAGHHHDPALRDRARHPDPAVRGAALIRVDAYRLALDDARRTLALLYPDADNHGDHP